MIQPEESNGRRWGSQPTEQEMWGSRKGGGWGEKLGFIFHKGRAHWLGEKWHVKRMRRDNVIKHPFGWRSKKRVGASERTDNPQLTDIFLKKLGKNQSQR